jgi:hypothetical protein
MEIPGSTSFKLMAPDALKIAHGRFNKFMPTDDTHEAFFPYIALKAYEASEIAAGRPPIFVTATYKGKKRAVIFEEPSVTPGTKPALDPAFTFQAVNIGDERFIQFWIDNYARKYLDNSLPNLWMGLDECRFIYSLYGVLDDEGNFVVGVPWDKPFPQNDDECLEAIKYFFKRVHELAPDIHLMCNMDSLTDWERYQEVYKTVDGFMTEDITQVIDLYDKPYFRRLLYRQFLWIQWMTSNNRAVIFRAIIPAGNLDRLRMGLVTYLLLRGDHSYFAPQDPATVTEVSPDLVTPMRKALGLPTGAMQSQSDQGGSSEGYRLLWRRCEKGIVYLNLTGASKTITLPTDRAYYDRGGHQITQLTLNDVTGDYVLTSPP